MGRRAKKAPVATKKRPTLAKRFKCPFCANDDVVECIMDRRNAIGKLSCRMCSASYQMGIHNLHEPIDVFSEWLDDCEAAERLNGTSSTPAGGASSGSAEDGRYQYEDDYGDEDDGYGGETMTTTSSSNKDFSGSQRKPTIASIGLDADSDDE